MDKFDLYRDIATRTGGDVYVGVVGPVRTGKSTFISKVMEELVVDNIPDVNVRKRALDELPQSADGKTVMTTQPKFVPNEAVCVSLSDALSVNMRFVDCVGYMVDGALGDKEDGKERLVKTPWSEEEMPFEKAAEIGTEKVIKEHSTIAVAILTDGSFTDIDRSGYAAAEQRVVSELKECGKPFVILLNSSRPKDAKTAALAEEMKTKFDAPVIVKNVLKLSDTDMCEVMESVLLEFGVKLIDFELPRWVNALDNDAPVVQEIVATAKTVAENVEKMRDYDKLDSMFEGLEFWQLPERVELDAGKGRVVVKVGVKDEVYYSVLSAYSNEAINDEYDVMRLVKTSAELRGKTEKILLAMDEVEEFGYGVVRPNSDELTLDEPTKLKQGTQYGVRLKASAPSYHIIKVDVEAEISPIVGSEEQSEGIVDSMTENYHSDVKSVWNTNIFGKSLSALVADGIDAKLDAMPKDAQSKMKRTLTRIVNEGKGGVICILL